MAISIGKRYAAASGAEVIVIKGSEGDLTDGAHPLVPKELAANLPSVEGDPSAPVIPVGRRFRSVNGAVEVLVVRAGKCDLRYNGEPLEVLTPKVLPSAD